MYIITVRRITSGELLKQRKGLRIAGGYGSSPGGSSQFSLTMPYRLLRLPTLAPDIISAIVNGKNPPQLTAKKLMRLTPQIPVDWTEQRKLLGFQQR